MFYMWDTAAVVTKALVDDAIVRGYQAAALYGEPSSGWHEVHAAADAEFIEASRMPRGVVLIHFGPDSAQAIAQADRLRALGVNVVAIAADKEWNDHFSYVAFGQAVVATGRYLAVEYGTPAGLSPDTAGFQRFWEAVPGDQAEPGSGFAIQYGQAVLGGSTVDVSRCADDFLPAGPPITPPDDEEDNPMHATNPNVPGRDDYAWVNGADSTVRHEWTLNGAVLGVETLAGGTAREILGMRWAGDTLLVKVIGTDDGYNAYTWYLPLAGSPTPPHPVLDQPAPPPQA